MILWSSNFLGLEHVRKAWIKYSSSELVDESSSVVFFSFFLPVFSVLSPVSLHGGFLICIPLRNGFLYYTFCISSQRLGCWLLFDGSIRNIDIVAVLALLLFFQCCCIDIVLLILPLLVRRHLSFYAVDFFCFCLREVTSITIDILRSIWAASDRNWITFHDFLIDFCMCALSSIVWLKCSRIRSLYVLPISQWVS